MTTIPALSIRQPWAYSIVHLGKRCENRTWATRYRGPILIHASAGLTRDEYLAFAYWWTHDYPKLVPPGTKIPNIPFQDDYQRGGIVGRAVIVDCIRSKGALPAGFTRERADREIAPWWQGPVGIVLDQVEPLPFVKCRGALGLFDVDESILKAA